LVKSNLEEFQDFYQGVSVDAGSPNDSLANHSALGMVHKVVAVVGSFLPETGIS
jgi:hypothetical protein